MSIINYILDTLKIVYNMKPTPPNNAKLIGINFDPSNPYTSTTDLRTYLTKPILIIYNENFDQFLDKNDYNPGGGNGALRKYRSDGSKGKFTTAHVYGIPTGLILHPDNLNDKYKSDKTYKNIIDDSISQIVNAVKKNDIKYILWSVDKSGNLGLGIFKEKYMVNETAEYITKEIKSKFSNKYWYGNKNKPVKNHGEYINLPSILNLIEEQVTKCNPNPYVDGQFSFRKNAGIAIMYSLDDILPYKKGQHITLHYLNFNMEHPNINQFIEKDEFDKCIVTNDFRNAIIKSYTENIQNKLKLISTGNVMKMGPFWALIFKPNNTKKITDFRVGVYNYISNLLNFNFKNNKQLIQKQGKYNKIDKIIYFCTPDGIPLYAIPEYAFGINKWKPHRSLFYISEQPNEPIIDQYSQINNDINFTNKKPRVSVRCNY